MRSQACCSCGLKLPLNSLFEINQQVYCEKCADQTVSSLQEAKAEFDIARVVDPSICSKCEGDAGSGEFGRVGGAPYCPACTESIYNVRYPAWLMASMAGVLVLLALSLAHGMKYFKAARDFYRAEHLVEQKQYREAVPMLQSVVALAPDCEKCILTLAKAGIFAGMPGEAWEAVEKHNGGKFTEKHGALWDEVSEAFKRVDRASELVAAANSAESAAAALDQVRQARSVYPEWQYLAEAEQELQSGVAFEMRDYDRFLALEEERLKKDPDSPMNLGGMASALACKYAVTGDDQYKTRAEEMLQRAQIASQSDPKEQERFVEYYERIRYRLDSREILTRKEYDQRFRPEQQKAVEQ